MVSITLRDVDKGGGGESMLPPPPHLEGNFCIEIHKKGGRNGRNGQFAPPPLGRKSPSPPPGRGRIHVPDSRRVYCVSQKATKSTLDLTNLKYFDETDRFHTSSTGSERVQHTWEVRNCLVPGIVRLCATESKKAASADSSWGGVRWGDPKVNLPLRTLNKLKKNLLSFLRHRSRILYFLIEDTHN